MSVRKRNESEDLFNMVQEKYGDRLNPEKLEEVHKAIEVIMEGVEALRSVELRNSDEPFSLFVPYRKDG